MKKAKRKSKAKRKRKLKLHAFFLKGPKKSHTFVVSNELLKSSHAARILAEECKRLDLGEPLTIQRGKVRL